jgi:hypothetical protein
LRATAEQPSFTLMVLIFLPFSNMVTPETSATAIRPAEAAIAFDPSISLLEAIEALCQTRTISIADFQQIRIANLPLTHRCQP